MVLVVSKILEVCNVINYFYFQKIDKNVIPDGVLTEIVTPANETTAIFRDVYVDVAYQFAVQAFTAEGDGPLSAPVRITLRLPRNKVATNEADLLGKKETRYK